MTENTQTLLSVEEALERVLGAFQELPADETDIREALGRVLAEDVRAPNDLPPFANSSMDGYAVRAADVAAANRESPVRLSVVADIPAGSALQVEIGPGQAGRIMTGAPMPAGADAVVPVEQTDDNFRHAGSGEQLDAPVPSHVSIFRGSKAGDYVRPVGEDVRSGDVVLRKGRVLRPADLGVLAGLGYPQVNVTRRPWV
ncbi:MAG TPA: hypothetical protein VKQ72_16390, partial [Aggregatilineales bacterium]|nr:hypothetical protein [Aggregatilineales bacterium]